MVQRIKTDRDYECENVRILPVNKEDNWKDEYKSVNLSYTTHSVWWMKDTSGYWIRVILDGFSSDLIMVPGYCTTDI